MNLCLMNKASSNDDDHSNGIERRPWVEELAAKRKSTLISE